MILLHKFTDTPMLREEYRDLQKDALKLMGRHARAKDFNGRVEAEMDYQGVQHTAQNWVNVAREIVELLTAQDKQVEPEVQMAEAV